MLKTAIVIIVGPFYVLKARTMSCTSREAVDKPRQLMQALAARIDRSSSSQSILWTCQFPIFFLDLRGLLRHRSSFHGRRRIDYTEHPLLRDEADFAHGMITPTLRPDEFLERFLQEDNSQIASGPEMRTNDFEEEDKIQPWRLLVGDIWEMFGDDNRRN